MTIPHNIDAERALLGGLIMDSSAIHRVPNVKADDFHLPAHRTLFKTISELGKSDKPADMVILTEKLAADGDLDDVGGATYLIDLMESSPSAANISHYAAIVTDKARSRGLLGLADTIRLMVNKGMTPDEIVAAVTTSLNSGENQRGGPEDIFEAVTEALEGFNCLQNGKKIGYSFGVSGLDNMLFGVRRGKIYVIAARTGRGKTTFANQILTGIEDPNAHILIEGRASDITEKRILAELNATPYDIVNGHFNWGEINRAAEKVSQTKTMFYKAKTIDEVVASIYQAVAKGATVAVVDYLQDIAARGKDIRERIETICTILSELPGKLNIALVLLVQLSRAHETEGRIPTLRDLQESSKIEQIGDVVIILFTLEKERGKYRAGDYAFVAKNRQTGGKTGIVPLTFDPRRQKFEQSYGEIS